MEHFVAIFKTKYSDFDISLHDSFISQLWLTVDIENKAFFRHVFELEKCRFFDTSLNLVIFTADTDAKNASKHF